MSAALAVTLTIEELSVLVRNAVRSEMALPTDSDLLTREQAAELLQVHPVVVSSYVKKHGLPATRIGPRALRFSKAAILTWLEARAVEPGAHTEHHGRKLRAARGT